MDPKIKSYLPLIIIFFVLGVVAGYLLHQPATIEKPIYINQTIETTVEKTVTATATPASTAIMTPTPTLTETPQPVPDFTVRSGTRIRIILRTPYSCGTRRLTLTHFP